MGEWCGQADGWVGRGALAHPVGWRLGAGVRLGRDEARGLPALLLSGGALPLNETAAAVLRLCDGSRGAADITAALLAEHHAVAGEQVLAFLSGLAEQGLIEGTCLGPGGSC
ncbi:PqqD family peptide modification chaperone [Kitasatospora sp. RB6PN24]|uniref:PqqD family peptide modification chaperone n=1 Tax=Kitasatospora humi TaxID=2893891 RepID=UPI001E595BF5|nr:PqqD family peptide modification chaperone [Kitasatospora humi]MCC9305969.1 PqqD family peptide modification chaperone [Kitasatospora humi]